MFLSPQLRGKRLADLCHRLGVQLEAGIDIRRVWQREADAAPAWLTGHYSKIRDAIAEGEKLPIALAASGSLFPRLFLEMVQVGDETGMLSEVFTRLSRHYQHSDQLRRSFLSRIAWPMMQLGIAVFVVGILIWVMGIIGARSGGSSIDILGFGLVGTRGLVIYINFLIAIGLLAAALFYAIRRGAIWTKPLQRLVITLPVIGPCIEKLCLARLCWAMHLTLNVAMDLRRLIPLVLRATGNDYYIQHAPAMVSDITAGMPLHVTFQNTGAFPVHFLDALQVGEESGQMVEAMGRLSKQYEDEAESAAQTLAMIAGGIVWAGVAMLIILMIFRIFGFYVGAINDAAGI